ncbi:hypothetical protein SLEP1_g14421 [Rubroshorea leprosula]|uniref:Uncharacterized protein n=1 Tax=Rubroshorea leprosula TaxID=152421 RepID=A0AAV5IPU0_9ROSI|nr:hypothetical protein SLEP1_g14421 [Rubroshorea leprosula]
MGELYRKWKHNLHKEYEKYSTDEERMRNIPEGLTETTWAEMIKIFSDPKFKGKSDKNSECRAELKM